MKGQGPILKNTVKSIGIAAAVLVFSLLITGLTIHYYGTDIHFNDTYYVFDTYTAYILISLILLTTVFVTLVAITKFRHRHYLAMLITILVVDAYFAVKWFLLLQEINFV